MRIKSTEIDLSSNDVKNVRFSSMDLAKFVCAILIVMIHEPPLKNSYPLANYILVDYIAKLAVPFYFVSSGYLLFRKINLEKCDNSVILSYIQRILKLYLLWTGIYSILFFYDIIKSKDGFLCGMLNVIRTFLIVGYNHLWYLLATIVAVLIIAFLINYKCSLKKILFLGVCLYMVGLLGQSWFGLIRPLQNIPIVWTLLKLGGGYNSYNSKRSFRGSPFYGNWNAFCT